jgi:S1-C subfamily serine protease
MGRWSELSGELEARVQEASPWVVRIEGRRGRPASGVVWSEDGLVLAADHSVDADEPVEVVLADGETAVGELVGRDAGLDLAVLRVRRNRLPAASWSGEAARVGQLVLELSRPGRGPRAAIGLVARVGPEWRTPAGGKVERYLELDLALRSGFSGSLLLDASGQGLGLAAGGLLRGAALALPPASLRRAVKAIVEHGGVRRGFLGVAMLPVRLPAEAGQAHGLLVTGVEPGSPAAGVGLALGDVLLSVEGRPLAHAGELLPFLEEDRIGTALPLRAWRAGSVREVAPTVAPHPGGSRS